MSTQGRASLYAQDQLKLAGRTDRLYTNAAKATPAAA